VNPSPAASDRHSLPSLAGRHPTAGRADTKLNQSWHEFVHLVTTHTRAFDQLDLAIVATHALFEVYVGPANGPRRAVLLADLAVVALLDVPAQGRRSGTARWRS
jgi:hypothetical protein